MSKLSEALKKYMQENTYNASQMADQIGVPSTTFRRWLHDGVFPKQHKHRELLEKLFPGVLDDTIHVPSFLCPDEAAVRIRSHDAAPADIDLVRAVDKRMYTHLLQQHIAALMPLLSWFIYEAIEIERHALRQHLGKQWEDFYILIRALVSEKALTISFSEGHLQKEALPHDSNNQNN